MRPLNYIRLTTAAATFIALQLIFGFGFNIIAASERLHASVPLVWLLDWVIFVRPERPFRWIRFAYGLIIGGFLVYMVEGIAELQAGGAGGWVDWREIFARIVLCLSLFVLYSLLSQFLTFLLRCLPASRRMIDAPQGWWLRGARAVISFSLFAPYIFTAFNVHPVKIRSAINPQSKFKLAYQDVSFRSDDGIKLSAWMIPAPNSRKAVIVCHGVGASKSIFIGVLPFLHRAGYNVLMFDFRGHGESEGHSISYGVHESRDVEAAVKYLAASKRYDQIVAYGFSMGGASVLLSIPRLPELSGVIVDSTFARFKPLVAQQFPFLPPAVANAVVEVSSFYSNLEVGVKIRDIEPREAIGKLSPRPIFIIHGLNDGLIPPTQARANYQAAGPRKELWLVPRARHCECRAVNEPVYEKKVTAFLKTVPSNLKQERKRSPR